MGKRHRRIRALSTPGQVARAATDKAGSKPIAQKTAYPSCVLPEAPRPGQTDRRPKPGRQPPTSSFIPRQAGALIRRRGEGGGELRPCVRVTEQGLSSSPPNRRPGFATLERCCLQRLGSLTSRNPSWWGDGGRDSSAGEGDDKGDQGEPEGGARESLHGGQAVPFERMVVALVETLRPRRVFPPCTVSRGSAQSIRVRMS